MDIKKVIEKDVAPTLSKWKRKDSTWVMMEAMNNIAESELLIHDQSIVDVAEEVLDFVERETLGLNGSE